MLHVWCGLGRISGRATLVVGRLLLLLLGDVGGLRVWLLGCVWRRVGTGEGWLRWLIELEGSLAWWPVLG